MAGGGPGGGLGAPTGGTGDNTEDDEEEEEVGGDLTLWELLLESAAPTPTAKGLWIVFWA